MMDYLKMKPDALTRADAIDPQYRKVYRVADAIELAFLDGAKAERERILKMLREPSDDTMRLTDAYTESGDLLLARLADAIEADPT